MTVIDLNAGNRGKTTQSKQKQLSLADRKTFRVATENKQFLYTQILQNN